MEEAVSSSEEACSSVRMDRLELPAEISSAPRNTSTAASFTCATICSMLSASWLIPRLITSKNACLPARSMRLLRSPLLTALSIPCSSFSTRTSCVRCVHSITVPSRAPFSSSTGLLMVLKVNSPRTLSCTSAPDRVSRMRRSWAG